MKNEWKINENTEIRLFSVQNLIDLKEGLSIPTYQRGYVWKANQIKDLLTSIIKENPIGTVFLFETDSKNFQVMDGQQRLTTLKDRLYKNVHKFTTYNLIKENIEWFELEANIIHKKVFKQTLKKINTTNKISFNDTYKDGLKEKIKKEIPEETLQKDIIKNLNKLFDKIGILNNKIIDLKIPALVYKESQDIEDVFIKINKAGKSLTAFEIMGANLAKYPLTFSEEDIRLVKDFYNSKIDREISSVLDLAYLLMLKLFSDNTNLELFHHIFIEKKQFDSFMVILNSIIYQEKINEKKSADLHKKITPEEIAHYLKKIYENDFDDWVKTIQMKFLDFHNKIPFLRVRKQAKDRTSKLLFTKDATFVSLFAALEVFNDIKMKEDEIERLYMYHKMRGTFSSGSTNKALSIIRKYLKDPERKIRIEPNEFENYITQEINKDTKGFNNTLVYFMTMFERKVYQRNLQYSTMESDHIIPKSLIKKSKIRSSLGNLQFLDSKTNLEKLNEVDFDKWVKPYDVLYKVENFKDAIKVVSNYYKEYQNCISKSSSCCKNPIQHAEKYIKKRESIILNVLKQSYRSEFFGESA